MQVYYAQAQKQPDRPEMHRADNEGERAECHPSLSISLFARSASPLTSFSPPVHLSLSLSSLSLPPRLSARTAALNEFRSGHTPLLVATDVAARGLDIPAVRSVSLHTLWLDVPIHARVPQERFTCTLSAFSHTPIATHTLTVPDIHTHALPP